MVDEGWAKAGEVAKVGVGAQCWAGWADMCVPTRVFEGGCGADRALQRTVYQCASKVGVPCPWGARETEQRVLPFGAPRASGTLAASGRDHRGSTGCRCLCPCTGDMQPAMASRKSDLFASHSLSRSAAKGPFASPRSCSCSRSRRSCPDPRSQPSGGRRSDEMR